jgi:hypothetical protein
VWGGGGHVWGAGGGGREQLERDPAARWSGAGPAAASPVRGEHPAEGSTVPGGTRSGSPATGAAARPGLR